MKMNFWKYISLKRCPQNVHHKTLLKPIVMTALKNVPKIKIVLDSRRKEQLVDFFPHFLWVVTQVTFSSLTKESCQKKCCDVKKNTWSFFCHQPARQSSNDQRKGQRRERRKKMLLFLFTVFPKTFGIFESSKNEKKNLHQKKFCVNW